jgi:hypothetical protein
MFVEAALAIARQHRNRALPEQYAAAQSQVCVAVDTRDSS